MSTRRPPTPNHTAPPDIRDTPPSRNTPSVRLISAVPSKAGLSIDSSPTYIPGFNTAVSSRAPTASSGLAPKVGGSTNRRRLVPRKSKLGLSGNTATEHVGTGLPSQPSMSGSRSASTSFSSTVDVVILNDSQGGKTRQTTFSKGKAKASEEFIKSFRQLGTHQSAVRPSSSQGPSARTTSLDVSVDTSSLVDPDVGEIVFVKKPKTRAGLDVMNWDGPPGGLDDDTSESHDDAPTLSRATAAALLKDSTLGRKNSIGRQKGQEPMKSIRQDDKQKDSKWWSIGRSKGRAKGKDEEDDDDDHDDHDDDEHLESRMEGRQSLRVKSKSLESKSSRVNVANHLLSRSRAYPHQVHSAR